MAENELNAEIVSVTEVAPGLVILRVKPVGWELPDFIPGQFAVLALPGSAPVPLLARGTKDKKPRINQVL